MAGDWAIRPLSLGDVVDRAVALTKASFLPLLALSGLGQHQPDRSSKVPLDDLLAH